MTPHGRRLGPIVMAMLVLAGCTSGVTSGRATVPSTTGLPPVELVRFDVCALSDDVVTQLQLVPSTRTTYNVGAPQGDETGCGWSNATINSSVSLDAGRSTRSVQDYLSNTAFADISATMVGSHEAAQFTLAEGTEDTNWSLAIGVPNGVVVMTATTSRGTAGAVLPDARTEVERMAAVLEPLLPT